MKNILLTVSCCAIFSAASAQIPNNSFENWTTVGAYSNPDEWGTMNNTTALAGVYTATKGTPGNPGSSYLKLTSKTVSGVGVVNGIAVSGKLDSTTMQPLSGFAYAQRPANFTGKWQHMIYGSSQGSISVSLTRWDAASGQRIPVGTASVTLSGMAMSWANFSLPFTYTDGGNPDTCIIILQASGSAPTNNDYLWVDNLAFSGTVTGLENQDLFLHAVNVYPNPGSELLVINMNLKSPQKIKVQLTDASGKVVVAEETGTLQGETNHSLDVSEFPAGIYFLSISGATGSETRRIIIE